MFASSNCEFRQCIDVYLDGEKVPDAIQADEEEGLVWAQYRNAEGKLVPSYNAPLGALIEEGGWSQVVLLRGKVEIRVTPPQGMLEDRVREKIAATSVPIEILEKAEAVVT